MSLPTDCQHALDALNLVGDRLKAAKAASTDCTALLADYTVAKTALDSLIRPLAEAEKERDASSELYWTIYAPVYERVMTKGERKKHDKEVKKRKKAAATATTTTSTSTTTDAPAISKSLQKKLDKAAKKKAANAAKALAKAAAATTAPTTTTTTTTPTPSTTSRTSSSGRASKSRRTTGPSLTAPLPLSPRTPVKGLIDPARSPLPSSLRQLLLVAHLTATPVTLGRFQTNALFMDVPSFDVGNGAVLSGVDTITEYLLAMKPLPTQMRPEICLMYVNNGADTTEWQAWCVAVLAPHVQALLPPVRSVGVVFDSVVTTKRIAEQRTHAVEQLTLVLHQLMQHPPTTGTMASLVVALRLSDIATSCQLATTSEVEVLSHPALQWSTEVLQNIVPATVTKTIATTVRYIYILSELVCSLLWHD